MNWFRASPSDVRKVSDLPSTTQLDSGLRPLAEMDPEKFRISRDSQALYMTLVCKDRLPIFRKDAVKNLVCRGIDEARNSGGFLLFAYVIMPDHMHLLTSCQMTRPVFFGTSRELLAVE